MFQKLILNQLKDKKNIAKLLNSDVIKNISDSGSEFLYQYIVEKYGENAKAIITFDQNKNAHISLIRIKRVGISVWDIEKIESFTLPELIDKIKSELK